MAGCDGRAVDAAVAELVARPPRVPKMAELVAGVLRGQIVRGELAEGEALPPESVLMERYGVSRPTLREAFRVLESERLIVIRRGSRGGARAQAPDREVAARYAGLILEHQNTSLRDVYEARVELEVASVGALARRRTDLDVAELNRALAAHEASRLDPITTIRRQSDFHMVLVRLARNETVALFTEILHGIISVADSSLRPGTGAAADRARRTSARAHRALVDLIVAGDAAGAQELWRRHLVEAEKYVLDGDASLTVLDLLD